MADISPVGASQKQPRAVGRAMIRSKARDGLSVLSDLKTSGCLKTLFPRGDRDRLTGVFLNTAGGITGGDQLRFQATARVGSRLCLTTQAAERIYRAQPGEVGHVDNRLTIEPGARLDWLPQETILFDHGALDRTLSVDMAADSRLLAVESLILGRSAMGETLTNTHLTDRIRVRRGDDLVFADTLRLGTDTLPRLTGPAMMGDALSLASVLFIAPEAEAHLPHLRTLMPATGGVSLIRPGVLFARILASDSFVLRQSLIPVLTYLNGTNLPRTWMI
ncbi:urease accessory protein UreD [Thalassovita sp.]|uniref:urease accessory protein UreD n=1 Tax=Thalassovita sp. TaxID=1979401 RepID=UPI0028814D43|nr:urease accessory protein UreD [Thalassovita sp.]MDF1802418.1 urease accessory protein UreD [Thalassovita sp.]